MAPKPIVHGMVICCIHCDSHIGCLFITKFIDTTLEKSAFFSNNMAPKREKHLVCPL